MKGVSERSKKWEKTEIGQRWRKENKLKYYRQIRIRSLVKLGGKCSRCGYKDLRALHIDHVNNDGAGERRNRRKIERAIWLGKVDNSRYQLLCANCNWIKRTEQAEVGKDDYNDYLKNIDKSFSLSKPRIL